MNDMTDLDKTVNSMSQKMTNGLKPSSNDQISNKNTKNNKKKVKSSPCSSPITKGNRNLDVINNQNNKLASPTPTSKTNTPQIEKMTESPDN
jgi:hypothetical protein